MGLALRAAGRGPLPDGSRIRFGREAGSLQACPRLPTPSLFPASFCLSASLPLCLSAAAALLRNANPHAHEGSRKPSSAIVKAHSRLLVCPSPFEVPETNELNLGEREGEGVPAAGESGNSPITPPSRTFSVEILQ